MPHDKVDLIDKLSEYGVLGYIWLLIISIWGGSVRYIADIKNGKVPTFIGWFFEAVVSGFVGVVTAMICHYYQIDYLLTAALTGIAAHNGTRTLYLIAEKLKLSIPPAP